MAFKTPLVTDEKRHNVPGDNCPFAHSLSSTANMQGFRALFLFRNSKEIAESLGLPDDVRPGTVYLQTSEPYQQFGSVRDAKSESVLAVSPENYLDLYAFFGTRWPLVCLELAATAQDLGKNLGWVPLEKNLYFANCGVARYSCRLGDLEFLASLECCKGGAETKMEAAVVREGKRFLLPLEAVQKLFSCPSAYAFLCQRYKEFRRLPSSQ